MSQSLIVAVGCDDGLLNRVTKGFVISHDLELLSVRAEMKTLDRPAYCQRLSVYLRISRFCGRQWSTRKVEWCYFFHVCILLGENCSETDRASVYKDRCMLLRTELCQRGFGWQCCFGLLKRMLFTLTPFPGYSVTSEPSQWTRHCSKVPDES